MIKCETRVIIMFYLSHFNKLIPEKNEQLIKSLLFKKNGVSTVELRYKSYIVYTSYLP